MADLVDPPLGNPVASIACSRVTANFRGPDEQHCGAPAVSHVLFDVDSDGDWVHGFVCTDHLGELITKWNHEGRHPTGPHCGMPGSRVAVDEHGASWCEHHGLDVAEPVRTIAEATRA